MTLSGLLALMAGLFLGGVAVLLWRTHVER